MSMSIEELKKDLETFTIRKEKAFQDFHQLSGAISVLQQLITEIETKENKDEEKYSQTDDEQFKVDVDDDGKVSL